MKAVIFLISYFLVVPLFLILTMVYYLYLSHSNKTITQKTPNVAYAALPSLANVLDYKIYQKDSRVDALQVFFKKYKSELVPFAQEVVRSADKYNVDYRLVPAIAMQESNLCKKAPKKSFNCWGWGVYGKYKFNFKSYTHGIEAVSKTLSEYKDEGLAEPEEIVRKYTPSNTGSWARSVNHFMEEIHILTL